MTPNVVLPRAGTARSAPARIPPGRTPARTAARRAGDGAVWAGTALAALSAFSAAYNSRVVAAPGTGAAPVVDKVSVLVPARDEARRIHACVRSLIAQQGVPDLEIVVLDDGSTDGTAALARDAAGGDPRVRVLTGEPLPEGWVGKPHACAQLARAATGTVLVFIDADVTLAPNAVAAAVTMLRDRGLDVLSPFPRQLAGTVAERLYQPLALWTWISTTRVLDGRAGARSSGGSLSGQFIVVDRGAYDAIGGHAAVREALVEDYALTATFRAAGRSCGAADGSGIADCRMYEGWAQLRAGYTRWMGLVVDTPAKLGTAVGLLGLAYLVPPAAALRGSRVGLAGYAFAVAGRAAASRRFGERVFPDAAAHPVSIGMLCMLMADGYVQRRLGRTQWKGRPV